MLPFAKLIFATTTWLSPGNDLAFPPMTILRADGVYVLESVSDIWQPAVECPPVQAGEVSTCVPQPARFIRSIVERLLCVSEAGEYSITFRLGMMPLAVGGAQGQVWLWGPESVYLTGFVANQGWAGGGETQVIGAPTSPTCWRLRYDSTGYAQVNLDTRATYLAIHRVR